MFDSIVKPIRSGRRSVVVLAAGVVVVACGTSSTTSPSMTSGNGTSSAVVEIVAGENFWGSIASQLGGDHARVISIIISPDADPHDYEPTPADARTMSRAQIVIANGVGYDPWVAKLVAADNSKAAVIDVGKLVGAADGTNPHRWYNPADVQTVVDQIVEQLRRVDPADSGYFDAQKVAFNTVALRDYNATIADIKAKYSGTPVGASESIVAMLAPAIGVDLITPSSFLKAISQGSDVSAGDKATIDQQIKSHAIKIYVYNSQNVTPDVQAQLDAVNAQKIPVATITETLTPATASYQQWQTAQLKGIEAALDQAAPGK